MFDNYINLKIYQYLLIQANEYMPYYIASLKNTEKLKSFFGIDTYG